MRPPHPAYFGAEDSAAGPACDGAAVRQRDGEAPTRAPAARPTLPHTVIDRNARDDERIPARGPHSPASLSTEIQGTMRASQPRGPR